jgi:hypothetical protein
MRGHKLRLFKRRTATAKEQRWDSAMVSKGPWHGMIRPQSHSHSIAFYRTDAWLGKLGRRSMTDQETECTDLRWEMIFPSTFDSISNVFPQR